MLIGKYLKKYYKRFAIPLIISILILAMVDVIQLFIPDLMGKLVELFVDGYDPEKVADLKF